MLVLLIGVTVAVFAVLAELRPRSEETAGRAEPVLAASVSRAGWVASHLAIALVGSAVLLALSGLGLGITASAALSDAAVLPRLVGATLAYLPAVWVTVGIGVALFAVAPRGSRLVWIVIAYAGVIGMFADLLGLPDWMVNLSPFGHIPLVPAVDIGWAALATLIANAASLIALGLYRFRRRDLAAT